LFCTTPSVHFCKSRNGSTVNFGHATKYLCFPILPLVGQLRLARIVAFISPVSHPRSLTFSITGVLSLKCVAGALFLMSSSPSPSRASPSSSSHVQQGRIQNGIFPLRPPDLQGAIDLLCRCWICLAKGSTELYAWWPAGITTTRFCQEPSKLQAGGVLRVAPGRRGLRSPAGAFAPACGLLRQYRYMMRQAGGGGGAPMTCVAAVGAGECLEMLGVCGCAAAWSWSELVARDVRCCCWDRAGRRRGRWGAHDLRARCARLETEVLSRFVSN
jgi:hypothetical protein